MNGIQQIAAKGRYGDNHLLHVSDAELQGLNALANEKFGRGLTTNPDTGLPEAFLFAPLLAPMLAPALGAAAGIGSTALATGLTAGALGTAEAAARDMDDPLQRGLMAGLTAGAGSALGESLAGAADAAGGVTPPMGPEEAGAIADITGPDLSQSLQIQPTPADKLFMSGADKFTSAGMPAPVGSPVAPLAPTYATPTTTTTSSMFPASTAASPATMPTADLQNVALEESLQTADDVLTGYRFPTQPTAFERFGGQYAEAPKALQGAKNILSDKSGQALRTFAKQNTMPLAAGAVGLGGQVQLDSAQSAREKREAMDQEKADKLAATQEAIRRNYAAVGRPMPTNPYTGRPIFANGGIVGLMEGGRPFDSAPGNITPEEQAFLAALMGGADYDKMKSAADALKESKEKKYAAGGSVFEALLGGRAKPMGYTASGEPIYDKNPAEMNAFQRLLYGLGVDSGAQAQNAMPRQADPKFQQFLGHLQGGAGNKAAAEASGYGKAAGGYLETGGRVGDGMSDDIPATIDGTQPAALSDGEFVIPADVVSHLGNGSSDAGAQQLYSMMDRIRQARTGTKEQGKEINAKKYMPA